jgi:hypothetical protein
MNKFILFLFFASNFLVAQNTKKDQLVKKLSDYTCNCFNKKVTTPENLNANLGLCIIEAVGKNQKEVDAIYGKNVITDDSKMDVLTEDMASKLAVDCPKFLEAVMAMSDDEDDTEEDLFMTGNISEIKSNQLLSFTFTEDSGKKTEFILLTEFENAFLLTDNVIKPTDLVEITYYTAEIYDAKIKKFVSFYVITDISKI